MAKFLFADRSDAARQLAGALARYAGINTLVLAIPRGAVPMGRVIADRLHGQLDVVLVRKLGAPGNRELAIGAIDETGWLYLADHARGLADEGYIEREKAEQLAVLCARRAAYTPARGPLEATGKTVIVVDDGLATGATMIAALHAARSRKPARLVCAVPVAASESLARVGPYADEVVCPHARADFSAVSQFYGYFPQVEDSEVIALLGSSPVAMER
jgi:putative phosphoribosyl transferase